MSHVAKVRMISWAAGSGHICLSVWVPGFSGKYAFACGWWFIRREEDANSPAKFGELRAKPELSLEELGVNCINRQ